MPSFRILRIACFATLVLLLGRVEVTAQEVVPEWFLKRTVRYRDQAITVDSFFRSRNAYQQRVVVIFDEVTNLDRKPHRLTKDARIIQSFGERAERRPDRVKVYFYVFVDPPDSLLIREYFRTKKISRSRTMIDIAPTADHPAMFQWGITEYPFYVAFNYRKQLLYVGPDRSALLRALSQ